MFYFEMSQYKISTWRCREPIRLQQIQLDSIAYSQKHVQKMCPMDTLSEDYRNIEILEIYL